NNQSDKRVGSLNEKARTIQVEEMWQHIARVIPRGGNDLHRYTLSHASHTFDIATETGHGEVDDRPHAEFIQACEPRDGPLDRRLLIPFRMRQAAIELRVADEHVLVDEGHPELRAVD